MLTGRLRLEPVGPRNAEDLWRVHADDEVWPSYGARRPTREEVARSAAGMGEAWRVHGVHKWMAYDRVTGELVGRGGLSRTPVDDDWAQLYAFLPDEPWVRAGRAGHHAHWLELGWALRGTSRGRGYAAEIGRAGLAYAFGTLDARAVVSCTVRENTRSRAVMERIGMRYAGEIRSPHPVTGADAPYAVCVLLRGDRDGDQEEGGSTSVWAGRPRPTGQETPVEWSGQ